MKHKDLDLKDKYVKDINDNAYLLGNIQDIIQRSIYAVEINDWTGLDSRVDVIGFNIAHFPKVYYNELTIITAEDFTRLLINNMRQSSKATTYPFKMTLERKMFFEYILNQEKK